MCSNAERLSTAQNQMYTAQNISGKSKDDIVQKEHKNWHK